MNLVGITSQMLLAMTLSGSASNLELDNSDNITSLDNVTNSAVGTFLQNNFNKTVCFPMMIINQGDDGKMKTERRENCQIVNHLPSGYKWEI